MSATIHDDEGGRLIGRPSDFQDAAQAAAGALLALAECIRSIGSVPSGRLYARVMGYMSLETYEALIGILVDAGKIRRHPTHLLEWTGKGEPVIENNQTRKETIR